jgi:hypothetical protein
MISSWELEQVDASAGNRTRGWPTFVDQKIQEMATANFTTKPPMLYEGDAKKWTYDARVTRGTARKEEVERCSWNRYQDLRTSSAQDAIQASNLSTTRRI